MVPEVSREYNQHSNPRANMFFVRPASLRPSPKGFAAAVAMPVRSREWTFQSAREPSISGFASHPTFARLRFVKSPSSTMITPPLGRSPRLAFSAAGFMATSTSGRSPGVTMS